MITQLPSEYLLVGGEYKIKYTFQIDKRSPLKFSTNDLDWISVIGEPLLPIHETPVATLEVSHNGKQVSWVEDAPTTNRGKAFKYSPEEIKFILEDVIY